MGPIKVRPLVNLYDKSHITRDILTDPGICVPYREDREFAELWLTVWSVICCVSTALTFSTFLLDTSRYVSGHLSAVCMEIFKLFK